MKIFPIQLLSSTVFSVSRMTARRTLHSTSVLSSIVSSDTASRKKGFNPLVAGVIGSAVGAGVTYSFFGQQEEKSLSDHAPKDFTKPTNTQSTTPLIIAQSPQPPLPVKPAAERLVTQLLKEAAAQQGLTVEGFSDNWFLIFTNPLSKEEHIVWGYRFPLNTQVSGEICDDKSALSDVLKRAGLPHFEHTFFINPKSEGWAPKEGVLKDLYAFFEKHGRNVVLKPNDGTGGIDVYHCTTPLALEQAALTIFQKYRALAASPYEEIQDEYRVVMLDEEPQLVFKKIRPSLVGDGKRTVQELFIQFISPQPNILKALASSTENPLSSLAVDRVPAKGEIVPLIWKHNLGGGASASIDIDTATKAALFTLAKKATQAAGIVFASVDIAATPNGFKVVEINSGVMMEKAPTFLPNGRKVAGTIYANAVSRMFRPPQGTPSSTLSTLESETPSSAPTPR